MERDIEMADRMVKKTKPRKMKGKGDFVLTISTLALVLFGIIMVFSASYYNSIADSDIADPYFYLIRATQWGIVGIVAMFVASIIDYHKYYGAIAIAGFIISIILLIAVLTNLGHGSHNAMRWIKLGPITIMPGELSKPAAIVFASYFLAKYAEKRMDFFSVILPLLLVAGLYGALIIKQPNLSTSITVMVIIVGILFVAGMKWKHAIGIVALGVGSIVLLLKYAPKGHWVQRIETFKDPFAYATNEGWQVVHSLYALSGGGLFGKGLSKSIEKNLWLPEAQNDFILAIIGEELGYVRTLLVFLVYFVILIRATDIALKAKDLFGTLLASGISIMIGIQVFFNVAVVTDTMPATGISLPFISYGGNSLVIFMGCIGILLNIKKKSEEELILK